MSLIGGHVLGNPIYAGKVIHKGAVPFSLVTSSRKEVCEIVFEKAA